MPLDLNDNNLTLVQVMAWFRQASSHFRSQCWPRLLSPYSQHMQNDPMLSVVNSYFKEGWYIQLSVIKNIHINAKRYLKMNQIHILFHCIMHLLGKSYVKTMDYIMFILWLSKTYRLPLCDCPSASNMYARGMGKIAGYQTITKETTNRVYISWHQLDRNLFTFPYT